LPYALGYGVKLKKHPAEDYRPISKKNENKHTWASQEII
jgi:hypothetical protein